MVLTMEFNKYHCFCGATTGTASFTPTDDTIYEGNETAIISISSVSGADATESGSQSVTITIVENDSTPVVTYLHLQLQLLKMRDHL